MMGVSPAQFVELMKNIPASAYGAHCGVGPDQLTIESLVQRVHEGEFTEVILATNPTTEGDGTSLYISNVLSEYDVEVTRLARGVTAGSVLEYTNKEILADAMTGRQRF